MRYWYPFVNLREPKQGFSVAQAGGVVVHLQGRIGGVGLYGKSVERKIFRQGRF